MMTQTTKITTITIITSSATAIAMPTIVLVDKEEGSTKERREIKL